MADPKGFLKITERQSAPSRQIEVRIKDWKEVVERADQATVANQASRCMDCGIAFCHHGCPLGNLIPEWNDLVWRDNGKEAIERLHATNNFPEFTGKLCPAPCESSCVLGINQPAVTIKQIELSIIEQAFDRGWVGINAPERMTGKTVAVIGSGPAGLAAAQQLTRAGHTVAVYEKDDRIGGLLRYGIPDFKMEKFHIDRRIEQMEAEGTRFRTGISVGEEISWDEIYRRYDAVLLATGADKPKDLSVPGRELDGIHFAMPYLTQANKTVAGDLIDGQVSAEGKHVVILGGGDTGADCLGTATRQGALSVTTLAIGQKPPSERPANQPWPMDANLFEIASAHEEFGERKYLASTVEFVGENGKLTGLRVAETEIVDGIRRPKVGTETVLPADLVLLSLGFTGPRSEIRINNELVAREHNGALSREDNYTTNIDGVFVAGDAGRGASLIVWAIAEGRAAAAEIDAFLEGQTVLPKPIKPSDRGIRA
ncbi:MAG: glutamate synthase subunit beta [Rhodoluna sp.]|jgi:glutamate synthase (NADPH/NADH) small chain